MVSLLRSGCDQSADECVGFLPELFKRWTKKATSHLVTIIFFARVHYDADEVAYLQRHDLTLGLTKDYQGRWCKDFFRVAVDFERRSDWNQSLTEIKQRLEQSEYEILLDFHLAQLKEKGYETEEKRIVGQWSFVNTNDRSGIRLIGIGIRRERPRSDQSCLEPLRRALHRSRPFAYRLIHDHHYSWHRSLRGG